MSRAIGLLLLIAVIAIPVTYMGCGPRVEVAKDAIIKKLDSALGELNVKRKKVEMKQDELQDKLAQLRENRYRSEARLDLLASKKQKSEEALSSLKGKIEQVQTLIKEVKESSDGKITRNEKEYTAEDIQETANDVAAMFKAEQTKQASLVTSHTALASSVKFLKDQEETSSRLMRELDQKIGEIDAKKVAVDAVRENTSIAGDNQSISQSLETMSKEIEDLGVDVEAALRIETDKMKELSNTNSKVDEILSEPADLNATEKMLDELLNKS